MDPAYDRHKLIFHLAYLVYQEHHRYTHLHQRDDEIDDPIYKPEGILILDNLLAHIDRLIIPYWLFDTDAHIDNPQDLWAQLPFQHQSTVRPEKYLLELYELAEMFDIEALTENQTTQESLSTPQFTDFGDFTYFTGPQWTNC